VRLLLDTNTWLWWIEENRKLSRRARRLIADARNECFFSLASCWEVALLQVAGKIKNARLDEIVETLAAGRIKLLDIKLAHVLATALLPLHHNDGFDRLLIAQAKAEELTIVGSDERFDAYDVKVAW
jgi:PIN domain nuclease of toxin-antitoxin system